MRSCRFDGVVIRFIIIFGNRKAQGWLWGFSTRGRRRRHAHHSRDVFEGWSVPCRGRCLRHGPGHASGRRRRRRWFAGNNLRLRYSLRLCNNHSRRIRSVRLSRRFVDAPEVIYRLKEFDLDIPFYGRKISRADHTANNIAPLRVRNCDGLTWREVTRKPQNRAILEHNDGPGVFLGRFRWSRGCLAFLVGQTSNRNSNFQTNRVGSSIRIMIRVALRTPCGRGRFG